MGFGVDGVGVIVATAAIPTIAAAGTATPTIAVVGMVRVSAFGSASRSQTKIGREVAVRRCLPLIEPGLAMRPNRR